MVRVVLERFMQRRRAPRGRPRCAPFNLQQTNEQKKIKKNVKKNKTTASEPGEAGLAAHAGKSRLSNALGWDAGHLLGVAHEDGVHRKVHEACEPAHHCVGDEGAEKDRDVV